MSDLFRLICCAVVGLFRSRAALQAEILVSFDISSMCCDGGRQSGWPSAISIDWYLLGSIGWFLKC
jgi:hypothetical protein